MCGLLGFNGTTIGLLLDYFWITLGKLLDNSWMTLELVLDYTWITLGLQWDCSWVALGLLLDYSWITLDLFGSNEIILDYVIQTFVYTFQFTHDLKGCLDCDYMNCSRWERINRLTKILNDETQKKWIRWIVRENDRKN